MKKMKRKVIKLKESDLEKLVKKILKEDMGGMDDTHPTFGDLNLSRMSGDDILSLLKRNKGEIKTDGDDDLEHGTFDDEAIHNYVSYNLNNNMANIFDIIGHDMPRELEGDEYEETMGNAYDDAFKHFKKFPETMTNRFDRKFNRFDESVKKSKSYKQILSNKRLRK